MCGAHQLHEAIILLILIGQIPDLADLILPPLPLLLFLLLVCLLLMFKFPCAQLLLSQCLLIYNKHTQIKICPSYNTNTLSLVCMALSHVCVSLSYQ